MFRKHSCSACFIILSAVILTACAAPAESPTPPPPTATPLPPTPTIEPTQSLTKLFITQTRIMGMVDVGGRRLAINCQGDGLPTLILESGIGMDDSYWSWSNFKTNLSQVTRTCSYSRAGLGISDPAPTPRTVQDLVNDLHTMLVNAEIPGPYILVGHSLGGWIVILYADQYPAEVAGMVLLDSAHPDDGLRFTAALPTESPGEDPVLTQARNDWANWYAQPLSNDSEWLDLLTSAEQVRAVTTLGNLPLTVLTDAALDLGYTPEINQLLSESWLSMQLELAALSTNSTQISIPDASHILWNEQPEQVRNWIRQMVEAMRK